jgi:hypothetical protein
VVPGSNVKLGPNERYRAAIELASSRTGVDPAVIAAIISAECAPLSMNKSHRIEVTEKEFLARHPERKRKPLDPKDPGDAELIEEWKAIYAEQKDGWDERSAPPRGTARGATQFLEGTWLGEAQRPGTYLNEVARSKGFVDFRDQVVAGKNDELLNLRYDITLAVVAAAEYDKNELGKLAQSEPWLFPQDMTDTQKAHYLYLAHHEGGRGASDILNRTLGDSRASVLLANNVPNQEKRDALLARHGSPSAAYQAWIREYLDERVQPDRFRP